MSDVLKETITVKDSKGGEYTFRIPTISYDIQVAYRAADVRRRAYPEAAGILGAIDLQAVQFSRYCAILELFLVGSTTLWPYGFKDSEIDKLDPRSPPVVNFERFPAVSIDMVYEVGGAFESEYAQFRNPGDTNNGSTGA